MSPQATKGAARKKSGPRLPRWLSHRGLVAAEAVLVVGIVRDIVNRSVQGSTLPNYGKVLLIMALTVGIFGGLFLFVEKLTARTVAGTHKVMRSVTGVMPYWVAHAGILFILFLLYANMHGLRVF
ncbi:MAG TPA: hypothetical protein VGR31_01125 [Planctomycetota bacterium]|jgi:hypothetical protein|nr:hypothetical protein [Planctomycetota bacterium]